MHVHVHEELNALAAAENGRGLSRRGHSSSDGSPPSVLRRASRTFAQLGAAPPLRARARACIRMDVPYVRALSVKRLRWSRAPSALISILIYFPLFFFSPPLLGCIRACVFAHV